MVYYELLENNAIGRTTNNIKIAQLHNYYNTDHIAKSEEDFIFAFDGNKYLKGTEPIKPQEEIDKENAFLRVQELKTFLANEDFKTIKFIQGKLSQEEFALVVEQCDKWRQEINELEAKYGII